MPRNAPFRELVYRLRPLEPAPDPPLPLLLARDAPDLVVETRVAHLDETGHVWRILNATGPAPQVKAAEAAFRAYRRDFVVEKQVMGRAPHGLILWYKYRAHPGAAGFSNTALAFRLLGRDCFITDRTHDGAITIRILARGGAALRAFLTRVQAEAAKRFAFRLVYLGPARSSVSPSLSATEESGLLEAYRAGFFEVPRRGSLKAVAQRLRLSPGAVGYRIRHGVAKLVSTYFEGVDPA